MYEPPAEEPSVKPRRASESRASAGEMDSDAAAPRLNPMTLSHSKKSQISSVAFSSPPTVDLVLYPHSFTSRNVRQCPRAGRRSRRYFPDWEKVETEKGGFSKPSQITGAPRGRNQHLVNMPFIYTHCEATSLQRCGCCIGSGLDHTERLCLLRLRTHLVLLSHRWFSHYHVYVRRSC